MIARIVAGVLALVLLASVGVAWMRDRAIARDPLPRAPAALASNPVTATDAADGDLPPAASEKTREQKRFDRYDHDRDGKVTRDEYLASRKKAFARLDTNGDGRLSFDEWAAKAESKFATADADKSGILDRTEFATTRAARKAAPRRVADCPPQREQAED